MAKLSLKFLLLIFSVIVFPSCEEKSSTPKKDFNFEYVSLNDSEIDSIYNSRKDDIVFLSFYPGMHYDIYQKQLKKEQKNQNLVFGVSAKKNTSSSVTTNNSWVYNDNSSSNSSSSYHIFELDSSMTKNLLYSSRNAIDLEISMEDNSVNLTSRESITDDQFGMALWLFKEKYGIPNDTLINNKIYSYFKKANKIITFDLNENSILTIRYFTTKSLINHIETFKKNFENKRKRKEDFEKGESKREKVIEEI